ncbi:CYTH and CHAD domain-containing protein [Pseudothauera nasutitermitis]|uniref:CYTH and CHAD domain-containing protein n=1 Tax=Pseudothauera nasutitermitis TaxID=2565930 RepID=A0A4S4AUL4_9RHOO|nr:CYTH and CHAD domain-containing protein [Pseudothauera nasutitermitis]THF62286.1 CYTH and CHAD domain-containing protein [Pseudothauera nasutitermitis]
MSEEIELKLSLPPRALAALRRHPLVAGAEKLGNAVTLDNTYHDTADLALKARKVAVRIRRRGRVLLQTVKCAAQSAGGLSSRPEWEQPYRDAFDFSQVDDPATAKLLARHAATLVPVFNTRFRRETRLHRAANGAEILLMIDRGEVIAGDRRAPICELELELQSGRATDLLELACELARGVPLMPNDMSKAERGYRLFLDQHARPARAEASTINARMDPVEAFRTLAFSALRQWQANTHGAAGHNDDAPEFIHQLRIATRRLRSLLRLFEPALPAGFTDTWGERLRETAERFGSARDLDVLNTELLDPLVPDWLTEGDALPRLLEVARAARAEARQAAVRGLDAAGQGRLMLEFTLALHCLPTNPLIDSADLVTFSRLRLSRLRKRARRRFEASDSLIPARLHALRIALKQLRYGVEFFAPLLPAKSTARYLDTLVRAQDTLGFLNDVDVARGRLDNWAEEDESLRPATAFVAGWHGPRYARLRRRTLQEVRPLLWGRAPWRT